MWVCVDLSSIDLGDDLHPCVSETSKRFTSWPHRKNYITRRIVDRAGKSEATLFDRVNSMTSLFRKVQFAALCPY
jgi:hypothetical protein